MYPFEKYRYYTAGNKIIAVSTYAGKTEGDTFDMEKGKQLAALRCAEKIAHKRIDRAKRKSREAEAAIEAAEAYAEKMEEYVDDAYDELAEIEDTIEELLEDM